MSNDARRREVAGDGECLHDGQKNPHGSRGDGVCLAFQVGRILPSTRVFLIGRYTYRNECQARKNPPERVFIMESKYEEMKNDTQHHPQ